MKDDKPKHHKPNKHPQTEIAEARDTISQYLLNPKGEIEGLLLCDGMFVTFPPHLSRELASLVKPQDEVVAVGRIEGPELMKGYAIINPETAMALRDTKPYPHDRSDASEPLKPLSVEGKIKHLKRDSRGRCNGAILDNGIILEFPPHAGETFVDWAKGDQAVHAVGFGTSNHHGASVAVAMVGDSPDTLAPIRPDRPEPEKPKHRGAPEEEEMQGE
ncbi:MAG: hypothetical protein JO170_23685 [Verrucomicrobia bacterium]|nr:hypothetical protein [Verrucomicrobiota bacterium]